MVTIRAPSGPSMMERSPSVGTSLTVMPAERLVVAGEDVDVDGTPLDFTNAEDAARMAAATRRGVACFLQVALFGIALVGAGGDGR